VAGLCPEPEDIPVPGLFPIPENMLVPGLFPMLRKAPKVAATPLLDEPTTVRTGPMAFSLDKTLLLLENREATSLSVLFVSSLNSVTVRINSSKLSLLLCMSWFFLNKSLVAWLMLFLLDCSTPLKLFLTLS